MKTEFINFNDESLPIGKRKQAYVKWAVSKGTDLDDAKKQANRKFGFEKKGKLLALVVDLDNVSSSREFGNRELFLGYDLRKYEDYKFYILNDDSKVEKYKEREQAEGWEVFVTYLSK